MSVPISTGLAAKKVAGNWSAWSASKLIALYECPLAFLFRYFLKQAVKENPLAVFGTALHYFFDRFYKVNYKSPDSFANAWKGFWMGICYERHGPRGFNSKPIPIAFRDRNQIGSLCGYGMKVVRDFYAKNLAYRDGNLRPATEVSFRVNFNNYTLRGQMDRIQPLKTKPQEEIWDYKPNLPEQTSLRNDLQMTIYDLAYRLKYGRKPAGLRIYDYKTGWTLFIRPRSQKHFQELLGWIREAHAYLWGVLFWQEYQFLPDGFQLEEFEYFPRSDVEQGIFSPRWFPNSSHCQFCPYYQHCENWRQQTRKSPVIKTLFELLRARKQRASYKQLDLFVSQRLF